MSADATNYVMEGCRLQDVAAKMVLTVLAWRAPKSKPDRASMTVAMLQERSGLKSRNGVKDALRRLIDAGEIKVLRAGGPGTASEYELLHVLRHMQERGVSVSDRSNADTYGSNADTYGSNGDTRVSASDPYKTIRLNKTNKTISADAPASATPSPSLPVSEKPAPKPKKAPAAKFDPESIPLPHGAAFQKWWSEFAEYRRGKIKGRHSPLTAQACKIILNELAAVNERDAVESIKKAIACSWIKPFPPEPPPKPKVLPLPAQGQPKQTALERHLAEMRAQYSAA